MSLKGQEKRNYCDASRWRTAIFLLFTIVQEKRGLAGWGITVSRFSPLPVLSHVIENSTKIFGLITGKAQGTTSPLRR